MKVIDILAVGVRILGLYMLVVLLKSVATVYQQVLYHFKEGRFWWRVCLFVSNLSERKSKVISP